MTCTGADDWTSGGPRFASLAFSMLILVSPAFAQEPVQESTPSQVVNSPWLPDVSSAAPLVLEGEGQAGPRGWSYSGHAQGGYETNPIFESNDDPASTTTRLGAGFGYQTAGRRSAFSLNADGGASFYFDLEGRNTYYYSGGLSWLHRFSSRTLFTLTEALTNDYGQKSPVLVGEGIVRPLDRALTSRSTATLRQTLSPVFGLEARAQYDHVNFSSPTLADGDQLEAMLALNRRYGERYAATLSYQFLSSNTGGQPRRNYHSGYLGGSKRLSLTATASVNLGFTALPQEGGGWRFIPSALARLNALNARTHLRIDARYEHKANQDFGLGTDRIADIASLALERPFGRKWSSNLGLNYTLSKDTGTQIDQNESFRYNTQSVNAGLAYRATRRLSLDLGYSYFRSTQVTPAVDDHTVSLGVTYKKEPQ